MKCEQARFVFTCCQVGADGALKHELSRNHPALRFAFSRPGFLTFKVVDPTAFGANQPLRSIFARCSGTSAGSVTVSHGRQHIRDALQFLPELRFRHAHVWHRDAGIPGEQGFEPFAVPEALELGNELLAEANSQGSQLRGAVVNRTAQVGDWVADIIIVDPDKWFMGWHRASTMPTRWPGGVPPLQPKADVISRAYWKMQESLKWSRLPLRKDDWCVELGSSPGGACQALLERGLNVIGIDPAEMHESLLANPRFTHLRARGADLKRREFANVSWLLADANVAPAYTLDTIEHIVTNRRVHVRGMLITLKISDWKLAADIDSYLDRIRSWGFRYVRARQLAFNKREICVLAARRKHALRRRAR